MIKSPQTPVVARRSRLHPDLAVLAISGPPHAVPQRDLLIAFAPYLFRGKQVGCLTRLSGSGLANVTSGGGQTASFVVRAR